MTNFSDLSNSLADAVESAAKSIVTVLAERPISGTVVGEDLILTVAHVLHADEVEITTPDGRTLSASVVGRDPGSDLALLRAQGLNLPALSAAGRPRIGELLLAVGRPPHGPQASLGLMEHAHTRRGWMDSGAQPFPGVSGGALLDARGGLVGVLNAGLRRGTLLTVSADHALKVSAALSSTGRMPRGYLGIGTQPVHLPDPNDPQGADNDERAADEHTAEHHNPEQRSNERREPDPRQRGWGKDERWGGRGHRGPDGWQRGGRGRGDWGRGDWRPGDWRHGDWRDGDWRDGGGGPQEGRPFDRRGPGERGPRGWDGFGPRRGGPSGRLGLIVVQVEEGSPAASAGLKLGDILLSLGGEPLRHPQELLAGIQTQAGETLTLRVLRGGEEQDVQVTIGER